MEDIKISPAVLTKSALARGAKSKDTVEDAAREFESLFLKQMLEQMWKSVPKSGFLSGDRAQEYYYDMYHENLADELSRNGGIGVQQVLVEGMRKYEQAAGSRTSNSQDDSE
jgi:flagellar protein FlgJ